MKIACMAALLGTAAGTLTAAAVILAWVYKVAAGINYPMTGTPALRVLYGTLSEAGPGSLLLGFVLSILLQGLHRNGRSRAAVHAIGALAGLPLGLLNLAAVIILHEGPASLEGLASLALPNARYLVLAALAGGAALGVVCASFVSRPTRQTA